MATAPEMGEDVQNGSGHTVHVGEERLGDQRDSHSSSVTAGRRPHLRDRG